MKKRPLRKCVACKEMKDKKDLVRIVKSKENKVSIDPSGKMNGRGAYLCLDIDCLNNVKENNQLARSLKTKVDDNILIELEKMIKEV